MKAAAQRLALRVEHGVGVLGIMALAEAATSVLGGWAYPLAVLSYLAVIIGTDRAGDR